MENQKVRDVNNILYKIFSILFLISFGTELFSMITGLWLPSVSLIKTMIIFMQICAVMVIVLVVKRKNNKKVVSGHHKVLLFLSITVLIFSVLISLGG